MADRIIKGATTYRTLVIWPYAIAPAVAGVLWFFMFNPSIGVLAYMLRAFGYDWNHYLDGSDAMVLIILAASWKQVSYNFLFFLAGLQAIPRSLIEAAAIDGAGPFKRFRTIIFPLLSPTTFFLLVVNIVYAFFDTFGIVHATTSGGPAQATTILVYKVFSDGFIGLDLGGSAAQSVVAHGRRHCAHRGPVPLHRAESGVLRRPDAHGRKSSLAHGAVAHRAVDRRADYRSADLDHIRSLDASRRGADVGADAALARGHFLQNYTTVLGTGMEAAGSVPVGMMMWNSLVMALMIAVGKISISIIAAYAIVYFRFPLRMTCFWMIFITLMLPVEVRILPTFAVVANLGMLNSYWGLSVPLIASATATFLFRQFFLTIPEELAEAARIDGAGPLKFFRDILLPLSRTNIAALFVILFIYGWNQYLWPLLVTTDESYYTIVMGIQRMVAVPDSEPVWHEIMATSMLAMLPPVLVVIFMQRLS